MSIKDSEDIVRVTVGVHTIIGGKLMTVNILCLNKEIFLFLTVLVTMFFLFFLDTNVITNKATRIKVSEFFICIFKL